MLMENKFLSKPVPRGTRTIWRYLSALFILFTFAIGNVWAEDVTWEGDNTVFVDKKLSDEVTTITVTKDASNSSKKISCINSTSNKQYLSINGGGKYLKFAAPSGYTITNIQIVWMSGANNQVLPILFGESISAVGTVESKDKAVTITNGGFKMTNQIATSAGTNCDSPDDIALPSGTKQVMIGRSGAYSIANYTIGEVEETVKFRLAGASGSYFTTAVGAESTPFIGRVTLTVVPEGYSITYHCNGATSGCPSDVASGATALPSTLATPEKTGFIFDKWYTDEGLTTPATAGATLTANANLYAGWTAAGGTQSAITYSNTKGATNSNPETYYEGTGVASFTALADVTDFHFTGWSPASISAEATGAQEITAQWVAAYNVTFSAGAGSGTVPATFQKWDGAKFNLPGQGSMVAPSGKAFDGWKANGTGSTLDAGSEYTMGNAAVNFVAQWKAVPTTLYSLTVTNTSSVNLNNGGAQNDLADDATIVGGGAYMQNDHASNAQQILGSTKLQFKAGTITLVMTLNNALKEGDTIKATGLNSEGLCFGVTFDRAGSLDNQLASDASYFIVPEGFEGKTTLYAWRHSGSGTTCASIIIRRPAERPIASTVITLSDMKVNNRSISSDSLATLVSAHSLTLKDEFAAAPEIKFNEHKVITYDDELLPATKESDKVYTVTATTVDGKWQAAQEINSVTYTVTATKLTSAKVYYYDGATKLGEEIVAIGESPVNAGDYDDKTLSSFVGWYNNADLAEEHKIADIAALVVTADVNVYGKWNPVYASSANIEQWVLDNSTKYDAVAQLGTLKYASNIANSLDSLNDDPSKDNRNYAYLGLKIKASGKMLDFRLANGQTVKVKLGATGNYPQVALNGGDYADMSLTDNVWTYTADGADAYISIKTPNNNTVVIKQIMVNEDLQTVTLPWRVTYNANGGTCATEEAIWKGAALILPNVTPADADHTFAGWYDEVSGGELQGVAGASYIPTDNEMLFAHFAPVEYAVNYAAGDHGSGDMAAANATEDHLAHGEHDGKPDGQLKQAGTVAQNQVGDKAQTEGADEKRREELAEIGFQIL